MIEKRNNSESRTLLMSIFMSSYGPVISGIGLFSGQSTTQIADFLRRTSELVSMIVSYIIYRKTADQNLNAKEKVHLEKISKLFVGLMMCVCGGMMFFLICTNDTKEKGNVTLGLVIAFLGVVANILFWRKYTKMNSSVPNTIIETQAKLYRTKSIIDICVFAALLSVTMFPASIISSWLDLSCSVIVSLYMVFCGLKIIDV